MKRNIRDGKEWERIGYQGIGRDGDDKGSGGMVMTRDRKEWGGMDGNYWKRLG